MKLKNKVAIITGGGGGIGRATAYLFAKEGAEVVVSDVNEGSGQETVNRILEEGGRSSFFKANVADPTEVESLIAYTASNYGGVDILFNNAGIGNSELKIEDLSIEEWDQVIDINLKGVFLGIKYVIPEMRKRGGGSIINTSSLLGFKGKKYMGPYNASKGGVSLHTQNAALEYGKENIRVNAVAPGVIDTPIIDGWKNDERKWPFISKANALGRIGSPDEVATAVLFLASSDASFITGSTIHVDGGGLTF
ncbi:glucose 1-dehydrogenase [Bacillus luteolus]|uniref:Glucose 1-dehydrogenase n=1 Tax=Litchfieldia luteola TaxID=682179 RepID=A0ABR9QKE2_9BACI|nr:glucose 1-dehydrogenase [Cytobacillus luteolus]MBE4908968.1 glucose 1-dehydrogenase [Cytobacillus luteolus]MBP1941827.1 NAD(P)-dependent dehydrogenase (short-subunit alcohol dehydrogenase family) [Cytobacillus luteolus]